ncbi:MAG: hypothetical protein JST10_17015 [Bacteroidetes bacterium]|nr:hypothetical protein [Bacteroidota bacterium]MBS1634264.1 hypothetical protein [Bacteroidota bacterium]
MNKYFFLISISLLLICQTGYSQDKSFTNGDRVSYIGSSIAMNGQCFHFTNLFYSTRYPARDVRFLNNGISGEWTDNILKRIDSDILSNNPTWCVLMIEENDLSPSLYMPDKKTEPDIKERQEKQVQHWMNNADLIVEKLLAKGVKVILQTPTVYDQYLKSSSPNGYGVNDNLERCAEHLRILSKKYSLPLVDCWTALNEINKKIQKEDSTKTIIGEDRVHVGSQGHFIMSTEFLKMQNVNGTVSDIFINARRNKTKSQKNCMIEGLTANAASVSFTSRSESLPFPTPSEINPDSFYNFTDKMNADIIKVKGLKKGKYTLTIDGTVISELSNKDLCKGINLSRFHTTPQYKQAELVLDSFREYWKNERQLRTIRYIEYQFSNMVKGTNSLKEVRAKMDDYLLKYGSGPNQKYFTNMFNTYCENKPTEQELYDKQENILKKIAQLNKPKSHSYVIAATSNHNH